MAVSECLIRRRVRFYEVDGAGIVHFSWYYRYMEEAECELWRAAGLSLSATSDVGFPRVAAAFEFKQPLRFDDQFDIRIQVMRMGRSSISYACTLTRDGELIAAGTMTVVCVTGTRGQVVSIPIPDVMRQALSL